MPITVPSCARDVVEIVGGDDAAGARHVLVDEGRIAGQELGHLRRDQAREHVVVGGRRGRDDDPDLLAAIELLDRLAVRLLAAGDQRARRRRPTAMIDIRPIDSPTVVVVIGSAIGATLAVEFRRSWNAARERQRRHVTSVAPAAASSTRCGPGLSPCSASTSSGVRSGPMPGRPGAAGQADTGDARQMECVEAAIEENWLTSARRSPPACRRARRASPRLLPAWRLADSTAASSAAWDAAPAPARAASPPGGAA